MSHFTQQPSWPYLWCCVDVAIAGGGKVFWWVGMKSPSLGQRQEGMGSWLPSLLLPLARAHFTWPWHSMSKALGTNCSLVWLEPLTTGSRDSEGWIQTPALDCETLGYSVSGLGSDPLGVSQHACRYPCWLTSAYCVSSCSFHNLPAGRECRQK